MLLLVGCNIYENAVQKAREALDQAPATLPTDSTPTYKVVVPPALENDKVVQFTSKDRLIALIGQFNSSPDDSLLALTTDEFLKNKQIFGVKRDAELVTALNGTIQLIQDKNKNAIQLLVQLHPLLVGDNQTFLKTVLARGFDSAPTLTVNLLNKFEQDKLCTLVTMTPEEITKEERYSYLDNRLNVIAPARLVTGQSPLYTPYIDTCLSQLRLEMSKENPPTDAIPPPTETIVVPDTTTTTPTTP